MNWKKYRTHIAFFRNTLKGIADQLDCFARRIIFRLRAVPYREGPKKILRKFNGVISRIKFRMHRTSFREALNLRKSGRAVGRRKLRIRSASLKDTFREVIRKPSRFVSIFAIIAIGVSFFVGLKSTSPDMKLTADSYFKSTRLMDLCVVNRLGFEEEDVNAICAMQGVSDVMPSYSAEAFVEYEGSRAVVRVLAVPEPYAGYQTLNQPVLLSGRLPQRSGECVIENSPKNSRQYKVGGTMVLHPGSEDEDLSDTFNASTFTIVGIVSSPQYISLERGSSTIGTGSFGCFMMILPEDFNYSVYTEIYVALSGADDVSAFSKQYDDIFFSCKADMEALGVLRGPIRYDHVIGEIQEKIDEGNAKIADAEAERDQKLGEARQEIADAKVQIAQAEQDLADAEEQYNTEITEAEQQLADGYTQYYDAKAQYDQDYAEFQATKADAEAQIAAAENDLSQLQSEINRLQADIASRPLTDPNLPSMYIQLAIMQQQYNAGQQELTRQKNELSNAEAQLANAKEKLDSTKKQLDSEKQRLEEAKVEAQQEIDDARQQIEDAKADLADAEMKYQDGENEANQKISDAKQDIADAEEELDDLEVPEWIVRGRQDNPGYTGYGENADRLDGVATLFPLFFLLVASLVCLTTMMRMVEEQRSQIGVYKAFGYNRLAIAMKYAAYASAASLLGTIVGVAVGYSFIPRVIYNAYDALYILPSIMTAVPWGVSVLSAVVSIFCTVATAFFACNSELISQTALLMRPKAPKPGKRIFIEKISAIWKRFSFISKVTSRNLLRYKIRFLMTVVGIAGCTALMVAGFGLQDSVTGIVPMQFGEVYTYDMVVRLQDDISASETAELHDSLSGDVGISQYLTTYQKTLDIKTEDDTIQVNLLIPEDPGQTEGIIALRNRADGAPVILNEQGVVITEKLAEILKVQRGDSITVLDDDRKIDLPIADITENYVEHFIYITPGFYDQAFDREAGCNTILVRFSPQADPETLAETWLTKDNIITVRLISDLTKSVKDSIDSLNTVVVVMIVAAALLAFVVLYNLTNINISERVREIATIKVLGFFNNEVSNFVFRENIIMALIGIVFGSGLGVILHRFVVLSSEVDIVMFDRAIQWPVFIYAGLLTLAFTLIVNIVMYFHLKKISVVESLKSLD